MFGRNLHDRVEAQLEELDGGFACDADVCLVHDGDHGLAERPDLLHDVEIARDEAGLAVEHDQHEIGLRQRPAPLLNHEIVQRILARPEEAACVDHREASLVPRDGVLDGVAGGARNGGHDGPARTGDPVEQCGLPDIGAAGEHDKGQRMVHGSGSCGTRPTGEGVTRSSDASRAPGDRFLTP